jgi:hypothetical protein
MLLRAAAAQQPAVGFVDDQDEIEGSSTDDAKG